jgi:hypothetical protein
VRQAAHAAQPSAVDGEEGLQRRVGGVQGSRWVLIVGLATLLALFVWLYLRFAGSLFFVLDDYIETELALSRPLGQAIADSFTGAINWSGYRPVTYAIRATLSHTLGLEWMWGYYLFGFGLLLANTLLTYHLVRSISRSDLWAYVAAAVVLLLPAHNEAVAYMSANANLLALLFSLLSLEAARRAWLSPARQAIWVAAAAVAYALAVLAYEVTLPLPLLVALAHGALHRRSEGERPPSLRAAWGLYAALAAAALVVLAMRFWAGGGQLTPERSDYAISLAPGNLLQGYTLFLGQLVLQQSSAWLHVPLYADLREWMEITNPRALVSIALAAAGTLATFALAFRSRREARGCKPPAPPFWMLWGLLWVLLIALPFAALAGRNPENRYTLIPSFGFGVAVAAAGAWLAGPLAQRTAGARLRQWSVALAATLLLGWFAYVTTSDMGEWERASAHARAFVRQAQAQAATLPPGAGLVQVGVPGTVGGAYVFSTGASFEAAMRLLYGNIAPIASSDLWLRDILEANQGHMTPLVGFGYDRESRTTRLLDSAWLCGAGCVPMGFQLPQTGEGQPGEGQPGAEQPGAAALPWVYAQVYNEATPAAGGLGLLFSTGAGGNVEAMQSCWAFFDTDTMQVDPAQFDADELAHRCLQTGAMLIESGQLHAVSIPRSGP